MGEIFEFILFELQCTDFSKIFSGRRGVDPLSTGEFLGKSIRQKKIKQTFSNFLGDPKPQAVPKSYKGVRGLHRGGRDLSSGENIFALRLSKLQI